MTRFFKQNTIVLVFCVSLSDKMKIKNYIVRVFTHIRYFLLMCIIAIAAYCAIAVLITQTETIETKKSERSILAQLDSIAPAYHFIGFSGDLNNVLFYDSSSNNKRISSHELIEVDRYIEWLSDEKIYAIERINASSLILYAYNQDETYVSKTTFSNQVDTLIKKDIINTLNIHNDNKLLIRKLMSIDSKLHTISLGQFDDHNIAKKHFTNTYLDEDNHLEITHVINLIPIYSIYIKKKDSLFNIVFYMHVFAMILCSLFSYRLISRYKKKRKTKDIKNNFVSKPRRKNGANQRKRKHN